MFCRFGSLDDSRPVAVCALAVVGVHAAGLGIDGVGQRVDVGALEFGELAVLEDVRRRSGVSGARLESTCSLVAY